MTAVHMNNQMTAVLRGTKDGQEIYSSADRYSIVVIYSADTYGNGRSGQLLTLCKALFAYSDRAKTYFTSIG